MEQFTTIWGARHWASLFLQEHGCEKGVADILLMHLLSMSQSQLLAAMQDDFPQDIQETFMEGIYQHVDKGTPVQHLIGYEYFYGRKFAVNPHVLIPRPETEELVELVLREIKAGFSKDDEILVVDIGTGSGIIGITLKKELPALHVKAVDISKDALQTAKQNAQDLNADVEFVEGDFLSPLVESGQRVDVIVSNPPYISPEDETSLDDVVRKHDPKLALFAEDEGLAAYKKIVSQLPEVMNRPALVAFEIGHQQGVAVQEIIKHKFPKAEPKVMQDINQKDRIVYSWMK
ncbi:peptide chain release factor N(5)-glutamine methyltransferase [Salinibacillus xinjiangensis]|uniref:Release factor glutamine methyltransferase n=1 Tax=Salinibacillus xinjiangensis TaxID=1229268 RepID=A0A6G1X5N1_9BACI|nr:peptide chain release factor N(5)-glutamine methyltransferase [Salinibacillus xinjiangensis]